jgi:hypothetical protein
LIYKDVCNDPFQGCRVTVTSAGGDLVMLHKKEIIVYDITEIAGKSYMRIIVAYLKSENLVREINVSLL